MTTRIAVTGGSGKLGRHVLARLRADGHDVWNLDRDGERGDRFVRVDLTDAGQVLDVLGGLDDNYAGLDAVVHLAAIPAPGLAPDTETFRNNVLAGWNVLHGAVRVGVRRLVHASSETVLGLPFETPPPYVPVDEDYPARPESTYSLVKHLEEQMCHQLVRWDPELSISGLRFSNVMDVEDYAGFSAFDADASLRRWNLWGYIDGRDGAQAVARALDAARPGYEAYVVANADTVMSRSSADLVAEVFPGVPVRRELGEHETLLSIEKARRLLGYEPQHSWRDHV